MKNLKRKLLVAVLAATAAVCSAIGFAACGGHSHSLTLVEENAATCTSDGNIAYYTCGGCDKLFADADGKSEITDKADVIILKGHKLTLIGENAATCTTDGNTAYYTCNGCDNWFTDKNGKNEITDKASVVIAKGHKLTLTEEKDSTCTEEGNTAYYTCSGCDKWFADETAESEIDDKSSVIIEKKQHALSLVAAQNASCTAAGNNAYYTCGSCDNWFEDSNAVKVIADKSSVIINKLPHEYENAYCVNCEMHEPTEGLEYTEYDDYCELTGIGTAVNTNIYIAEEFNGKPVTSISAHAFWMNTKLTAVTIPDSITTIGNYAFFQCSRLESVKLPEGLLSIGKGLFENCENLKDLTIPDSVTSIGSSAFIACGKLEQNENNLIYIDNWVIGCNYQAQSVTVRDNTKGISGDAFNSKDNLTSIIIPDSVDYICDFAFFYCKNLSDITFNGTKEQWNAIKKGESWNERTGDYTIHCTDGDIVKE